MEGTGDEGGFWEGGKKKRAARLGRGGIWKIGRDPSKSAHKESRGEGMAVGKQALSSPNRTMELFPAAR